MCQIQGAQSCRAGKVFTPVGSAPNDYFGGVGALVL